MVQIQGEVQARLEAEAAAQQAQTVLKGFMMEASQTQQTLEDQFQALASQSSAQVSVCQLS